MKREGCRVHFSPAEEVEGEHGRQNCERETARLNELKGEKKKEGEQASGICLNAMHAMLGRSSLNPLQHCAFR